uniref:CAAX prenyl protease 2/Lysostaphin resistance protein A-like domain-containing protein n=1 Tax=Arundo donax TaxID=35708 RepID=A0A0A8Y4V0_ARUDO
MSSASCLAPPPPRLPCPRARLPPPSSAVAAARPSPGFGPRRAAPAKGWRLVYAPCFRHDQDGPTTSEDAVGFQYDAQSGRSGGTEAKAEEVESSNVEEEWKFKDGGWFVQLQKIKENLQGRILRFQKERWTVPWTGETIAQVMILWIATFWLVGSWIVPFLAHAAGFSKETLTHRGQALYSLLTDVTEGLAGIAILHQCLGRFRPLPPGWFEFNLKGRWHLDVALGCLLFPLVNLLSHINISLVPMSPGPVVGVSSVEQSIVARDPVAMALYAVVVTVCAPIWEEIVFRGFLLPSLTRYMPLPWSILVSAAAFALAHFNAQRVMPLIFLGVVMGGVFARSRNLLASMVLHSLWNGFVFLDLMK